MHDESDPATSLPLPFLHPRTRTPSRYMTMLPAFGDEWKRKINLGGVSTAATPQAIFDRVQAERLARAEHKQRTESAVRIQAWYRGAVGARRARNDMRAAFEGDVLGLTGLRCLVLIGSDDEISGRWAGAVCEIGQDRLLEPAAGPHSASWLVLIRQASLLLLRSVADKPESPNALSYLRILNILLSNEAATKSLGANGPRVCSIITEYLLRNGLYELLSQAIRRIPVESKKSPSLLPLTNLVTLPLSTFDAQSPLHTQCLPLIFTHILTIPLLPNRLPLEALPKFIASLPLSTLHTLDAHLPSILQRTSIADKIHLAANTFMFIAPHYKLLPPQAFGTYLNMEIALFNAFPAEIFAPRPSRAVAGSKHAKKLQGQKKVQQQQQQHSNQHQQHQQQRFASTRLLQRDEYDNDSDASDVRVTVVSDFTLVPTPLTPTPPSPPLAIDAKTTARLEKIAGAAHLAGLIAAAQAKRGVFGALVAYLYALTAAWGGAGGAGAGVGGAGGGGGNGGHGGGNGAGEILNVVLASAGGGFVREVYRELVRRAPLGREENSGNLMDPANAAHWPPVLFLADLYAQALLTMGDDEFFGLSAGPSSGGGGGVRNPLTLDELVALSRQLLNIAFTLFYRDEQGMMHEHVSGDVRCSWEGVRDKVTRCLLGIHARDSRKSFVPADHWLVTSHLDMNLFVEAAVLEEQQLSKPDAPHPRLLSKRQIASMSPRLGILNNIPFAIPFAVRVSIFRHFVLNDMMSRGSGGAGARRHHGFGVGQRARVQVRRGMVAQDGFDRLGEVDLKAPVEIAFIDQFGEEEAGIDGGGVFKEFFTSLCKEVFDTDRGLWLANTNNELYPNPHAYATEAHSLNWYRFIGRILGKAMYEGILVDVAFAGFFLAKWLGRQSFLDDLSSLDPELYNGLIFLKHYNGNPEDLALNFTMAVDEFGVNKTVDLIPNGSNIAVTRENRLTYITLVSHYRLSKQIKLQSAAFFEGLSEMIDQKWLRMFNQQEAQILIGGVNAPIDLEDLRRYTNYGGLYDDGHEVIRAFWNVVETFDQEQRRALLRFVTSCSRPPLLGFKELVPNFSIRDAGSDQYRLPTSSTCVNLLKLPRYNDEQILRTKLLQAINSNAGFDLS